MPHSTVEETKPQSSGGIQIRVSRDRRRGSRKGFQTGVGSVQKSVRSCWACGSHEGPGVLPLSQQPGPQWLGTRQEQGTGVTQGACRYADATGGSHRSFSKFRLREGLPARGGLLEPQL